MILFVVSRDFPYFEEVSDWSDRIFRSISDPLLCVLQFYPEFLVGAGSASSMESLPSVTSTSPAAWVLSWLEGSDSLAPRGGLELRLFGVLDLIEAPFQVRFVRLHLSGLLDAEPTLTRSAVAA